MSVTLYKIPHFDIPMSQVRDEAHGGLFVMGGPGFNFGNPTPHWVRLPGGAELSSSHVTEDQFSRVMREAKKGKSLLKEISGTYRKQLKRPFGQKEFRNHPVTCVSWDHLTVFFKILNGVFGITDENQKYRRPTEAESEFMIRGGWICVQEVAKKEEVPIDTWTQFLGFVGDRFENFVSTIAVTSPIFNISNTSNEEELKKLFERGQGLYALRVYGSASGKLDESIWWGKTTPLTREIRTIFGQGEVLDSSDYSLKTETLKNNKDDFGMYKVDSETLTSELNFLAEEGGIHPYGLTDPTGNIYGLCEDDWDLNAYQRQQGMVNPLVKIQNNIKKISRGGSSVDNVSVRLRAAGRFYAFSDRPSPQVGFRCARGIKLGGLPPSS